MTPQYVIGNVTEKKTRQVTWPKFVSYLPKNSYKWDREIQAYRLDSGAIIYIAGAWNVDDWEGWTLNGGWLDEAGNMPEAIKNKIEARTAIKMGWINYTSSIYTGDWFYDYILSFENMTPEEREKADFEVYIMRSIDNPAFSMEAYLKAKRENTAEIFERDYNANMITSSGKIYNVRQDLNKFSVLPSWDWFDVVIAGVDFGFNLPASIVVVGIRDGTYYILDCYVKAGVRVDEDEHNKGGETLIKVARALMDKWHIYKFYYDWEDKDAADKMKRARLPLKPAKKEVYDGIVKCQNLLLTGKLKIYTGCRIWFEEAARYSWQLDTRRMITNRPKKGNDHAMDAMRYAINSHPYHTPDNSQTIMNKDVNELTPQDWNEIRAAASKPESYMNKYIKQNNNGWFKSDWYRDVDNDLPY